VREIEIVARALILELQAGTSSGLITRESRTVYAPAMNLRILRDRAQLFLSPAIRDVGLAVALIAVQTATNPAAPASSQALSALAILPLTLRRRLPFVAALAMGSMLAVGEVLTDPQEDEAFLILVAAILIVLYSVGAYERSLPWSIAGGLVLAVGARTDLILEGFGTDNFWPFTVLFMGGAWVTGRLVHQRRIETEDLTAKTARLTEEQEARTCKAVADERGRLARELHDVIAHAVSVMVVQASAAEQVFEDSPGQARDALQTIQETGRQTVVELRRLLGILRGYEGEPETHPQPSLAGLEALVEQVRRSGLLVEVAVEGSPRRAPASLDLSAYRIVQEGLTNALRHADATQITVAIRYGPQVLELEITDNGRGISETGIWGHGLLGIRERVTLFNGAMAAENRPEGGFVLRALLPFKGETE
jgi:signal transduction histidine kinase